MPTDTDEQQENLPTPKPIPRVGKGCIVDKMVGRWGPYRYLVTKHKGKQTWKYLGRTRDFTGLVRTEDGKRR